MEGLPDLLTKHEINRITSREELRRRLVEVTNMMKMSHIDNKSLKNQVIKQKNKIGKANTLSKALKDFLNE